MKKKFRFRKKKWLRCRIWTLLSVPYTKTWFQSYTTISKVVFTCLDFSSSFWRNEFAAKWMERYSFIKSINSLCMHSPDLNCSRQTTSAPHILNCEVKWVWHIFDKLLQNWVEREAFYRDLFFKNVRRVSKVQIFWER